MRVALPIRQRPSYSAIPPRDTRRRRGVDTALPLQPNDEAVSRADARLVP